MSRRPHFLVAGFDFGTRYSKVVLKEQNTGVAEPVAFESNNPFLFPSHVRLESGYLMPPSEDAPPEGKIRYLKMLAGSCWASGELDSKTFRVPDEFRNLCDEVGAATAATTVASYYFALVLHDIRKSILRNRDWKDFDFAQNTLRDLWAVQLCVPVGVLEGKPAVEKEYQEALFLAWKHHLLLAEKDSVSVRDWMDACGAALKNRVSQEERNVLQKTCITYPEVAAGVQSILRSKSARDGRYLTMDVGAGTIDLNAFFRASGEKFGSEETSRSLEYYAARVENLGADHIAERVAAEAGRSGDTGRFGISPRPRAEIKNEAKVVVAKLFRDALKHQPNHGSKDGQRTWDRDTYLYLWGGGSQEPAYRQALEESLTESGIAEPEVRKLQEPEGLTVPAELDFGRLAIAYGLSHYVLNLEKVRLPKELTEFYDAYPELAPGKNRGLLGDGQNCSCGNLNPNCSICGGTGWVDGGGRDRSASADVSAAARLQKERERKDAQRSRIKKSSSSNQAELDSKDRQLLLGMLANFRDKGATMSFEQLYLLFSPLPKLIEKYRVRRGSEPQELRSAREVLESLRRKPQEIRVSAEWREDFHGNSDVHFFHLHVPVGSPVKGLRFSTDRKKMLQVIKAHPPGTVFRMWGALKLARVRRGRRSTLLVHVQNPTSYEVL